MADFVAVLRKTIGTLGENSPEMREKVFEKARATIEAKLAAMDPLPPEAVIERQRKALEDAIAVVRADYAPAKPQDAGDGLEDVLAALDEPAASIPVTPMPAPVQRQPAAERADASGPVPQAEAARGPSAPAAPAPASAQRATDIAADTLEAPAASERLAGDTAPRRAAASGARGGNRRAGIAAALGLLVLAAAGGGYVWLTGDKPVPAADTPAAAPAAQDEAATTAEELSATPPDAPQAGTEAEPPAQQEAAAPEPASPPAAPAAGNGPEKFTQRLLADGSEVDEGAAGGQPGIGEGSSVATAAQPSATPPAETPAATPAPADGDQPAPPAETAAAPQAEAGPAEPAPQAAATQQQPAGIAVGQRAIFYEERTTAAQGSAEMGSIVWTLVQESPGGDMPPEPAIRAEATIPGKDVQLRMTIRRNGDTTLPASHIVEMIFLTPDGFEGGAISNVSRIAFKDTEQAPGNPLIGIPAKIADGFFLIALSDAPAETQANLNLLQRQSWVDIPIVYQSGRRALLSMEKGVPGERVFQDALRAWSERGSG